tara:strand:+ start:469 stop:582 length:114 start_codon:yes stop_codon:yes gene_type:complete
MEENLIGYLEIPEDYWTTTTTTDMLNPNLYWHNEEDE